MSYIQIVNCSSSVDLTFVYIRVDVSIIPKDATIIVTCLISFSDGNSDETVGVPAADNEDLPGNGEFRRFAFLIVLAMSTFIVSSVIVNLRRRQMKQKNPRYRLDDGTYVDTSDNRNTERERELADLTEMCFQDITNVSEGTRTHKYEAIHDVTSLIMTPAVIDDLCEEAEFSKMDGTIKLPTRSYLQNTTHKVTGETSGATRNSEINKRHLKELKEFPQGGCIDIRDYSFENKTKLTTLYDVVDIVTLPEYHGMRQGTKTVQSKESDVHTEDKTDGENLSNVDTTETITKKGNQLNQVDILSADVVTLTDEQRLPCKMVKNVAYESCLINDNI